jgi:hypothetical protein
MPAAASDLETGLHNWTRMVKLALGLLTPTSPPAGDLVVSAVSSSRVQFMLRGRGAGPCRGRRCGAAGPGGRCG